MMNKYFDFPQHEKYLNIIKYIANNDFENIKDYRFIIINKNKKYYFLVKKVKRFDENLN